MHLRTFAALALATAASAIATPRAAAAQSPQTAAAQSPQTAAAQSPRAAAAQSPQPAAAQSMPGMFMPQPADASPMAMKPASSLVESILNHTSSGTTIEPASTPMPMWMFAAHPRGWQFMLHGNAFLSDIQQQAATPPPANDRRGADKLFSTNWIMPMAMHSLGTRGKITFRAMLDLEPATITGREYPELFQQGETAYGRAIVDGQHPHDFLMELAALYDLRLSEHTLLSLYAAPVGDPALGPTAYPHRQSASEDPIAALGHHQQDSTHIAFNVLTGGLTQGPFRLEVSGFHGGEPDEARWHFQPSPNGTVPDSYSTRLTYAPTGNLAAQYSIGRISSPEALHPDEAQRRQTASVMYNHPLGVTHDTHTMPGMDMGTAANGNWSSTLLWGQTLALPASGPAGALINSYLLESLLNLHRNYYYMRVEIAGRTDELEQQNQPGGSAIANPSEEASVGHVQAYTLGYDRDYHLTRHLLAAPGAQFTAYRTPDALTSIYGRHPFGAVIFVRFRITQ